MQLPRIHLRTLMTAVAFLALTLALIIQSSRLHQALARERRSLADARRAAALAEAQLLQVRATHEEFGAALSKLKSERAEQQSQPTAASHNP